MSQGQDVELIRRVLDAWNRRDIEDLLGMCDPGIEFVNSPTAVEPGTRRGFDETTAAFQAQWDVLLDSRQEIERIFDDGDEILTLGLLSRRMPESEARLEQPILMSWQTRDGKLTRMEVLGLGGGEVETALGRRR
jgi:ketosteroid isomerase-like protein